MNTNVVDRKRSGGGRNPSQTYALWASLHEITKTHLIPVSTSPAFPDWHRIHIAPKFPYETPLGWYGHIRKIASEAKFTTLPHFPPLPDAAWQGQTPKLKIKGRKMYSRVAPDLNHSYADRGTFLPGQRLWQLTLSDPSLKVSPSVASNSLLGWNLFDHAAAFMAMVEGDSTETIGADLKWSRVTKGTGLLNKLKKYRPNDQSLSLSRR
jgi:hypothetical protein